jgi:hypothetical protein
MPSSTYATDEAAEKRFDEDESRLVAASSARREDLHIRNLDLKRGYNLRVEVRDGESVFTREYRLGPGERHSELDQLAPGTYTVVASLGDGRRRATRCTINDRPARAALIEIGNGTVSVTDGLHR